MMIRTFLLTLFLSLVGLGGLSVQAQEAEPQTDFATEDRARADRVIKDARAGLSERTIDKSQKGERILDFHSEIVIGRDGLLDVEETIVVRAQRNEIKRGIFRDFPMIYSKVTGRTKVPFDVISVQRDGKDEHYKVEGLMGGKRVKIGQEKVILKPGVYEYRIRYRTGRQLGDFETHDELYWNVTGTNWLFPIDSATAAITLPGAAKVKGHEGYTGPRGSKATNLTSKLLKDGRVQFETTERLRLKEGLTAVVSFEKGTVDHDLQKAGWLARNWPMMGALVSLLGAGGYFFVQWLRVGVDPEKGTIIPLYEPPARYSPAACRYLMEQGFDANCFSSAVIDLAVRGLITIEKKDKRTYILHGTGAPAPADLPEDEAKLLMQLALGTGYLELKQKNHSQIQRARRSIADNLKGRMKNVLFRKNTLVWLPGVILCVLPLLFAAFSSRNPATPAFLGVFLCFWTIPVSFLLYAIYSNVRDRNYGQVIFFCLFIAVFGGAWCFLIFMFFHEVGSWLYLPIVLVGIALAILFKHLIKAPSVEGRKIMDKIEGFKEYLSVAEEDRLNLQNPPEETPELFERFLPYAHALGCDQQWSNRFESILAAAGNVGQGSRAGYQPGWYSGMDGRDLAGAGLGAALGTAMASTLSSAGASPGSSSGSGGGGSSGGGGGGGGGGGW